MKTQKEATRRAVGHPGSDAKGDAPDSRAPRGAHGTSDPSGDLVSGAEWDARWIVYGGGEPPAGTRPHPLRHRVRRAVVRYRELDRVFAETIDGLDPDRDGRADPAGRAEILELGCAPGSMLLRVHRLRPDCGLHGVDASPHGIEHARQALAAAGAGAALYRGDIRTIELPQRYDLVFSAGLVEHFADPEAIVRRHAELATPGGTVLVTVPNFAHPAARRLLARFSPETLQTHNLAIMNAGALGEALAIAGLEEIAAGSCEGPRLPGAGPLKKGSGRIYRQAVRGWNLLAALTPRFMRLWNFIIWARGTVPRHAEDYERSSGAGNAGCEQ
jgi:2-polyprenyl-3-methyl-5-hydroxy-6-metoxy-1,4-benzoquinol methylase